MIHIVCDHQTGDVPPGDDFFREGEHFVRCGGVKGGSMLVEQKNAGRYHGCHQKRERLPLPAGKESDRLFHPILQPHVQKGELFPELLLVLRADPAEIGMTPGGGAQVGERHVFLNGHVGRGSFQGILKKMPDHFAPHMFLAVSDILAAQNNPPFIHIEVSRDGVKERGFSRAVAAHNGGEIAVLKSEAHLVKSLFLVDGAGVKGFGDRFND